MRSKMRGTNAQPTGSEASALPFWKLDYSAFEQFCTDWLNYHPKIICQREGKVSELRVISASRLGGGTDQRGGDIQVELESNEVWLVQCKKVKSFSPAKVRETINRAEKDRPDIRQYVLVTTCSLSDKAQIEIHSRSRWMWWDASRLTTEVQKLLPVENGMKLVQSFEQFGTEWVRRLFPWGPNILLSWKEFYAHDLADDRRLFHHKTAFVSGETLSLLEAFAKDEAGKALILSSSGGQGKSRLLLELAKRLDSAAGMPRVRFLQVGGRQIEAETIDLLGRESDLVLVVEDAHRLDQVLGQVASAASKSKSIRLLVATRPQAREAVNSQLFQNGYAERILKPLELPRWSRGEIESLAHNVLNSSKQLHVPRLAALADRCPLLVVLGGALINSGSIPEAMTNEETFRELVFKGFQDEFLRLQAEVKRDRLRRLIRFIALISPTPRTNELLQKAGEIVECSALDVAEDMDLLLASGLLAENAEGIRLYPDLFADAVALNFCLDGNGRTSPLLSSIIAKLPGKDFPALLRNLAQADWESRSKRKAKNSFFDPVWSEFICRFQSSTWWGRRELINEWSAFGVFQPERTLELAELALRSTLDPSSAAEESKYLGHRKAMLDSLPSMMKPIVMWHPNLARNALDLLWQLDSKQPHPNHSLDHSPIGIISSVAKFSVEPHHGPSSVIAWLEKELSNESSINRLRKEPWLLPALLDSYFARVAERSWHTGKTVHFQSIPLSAERTKPFRDRALTIAKQFAYSGDLQLVIPALRVLRAGIERFFPRYRLEAGQANWDEWRPARLEALDALKTTILANQSSHTIQFVIRQQLRDIIKYDKDSAFVDACAKVLSSIPDTFELRFARVIASAAHDEIQDGRSDIGLDDYKNCEQVWRKFCREVVEDAAARFTTANAFLSFLRQENKVLRQAGLSVQPDVALNLLALKSHAWGEALLRELCSSEATDFDYDLGAVLGPVSQAASDIYTQVLYRLPEVGRIGQVCSLIKHLGLKGFHGGGLSAVDRTSMDLCADRDEEDVLCTVAWVLGHYLVSESSWGLELLSRLVPETEKGAKEVILSLEQFCKNHMGRLNWDLIEKSLKNVGAFCLSLTAEVENSLDKIAKLYPRQTYNLFRDLTQSSASSDSNVLFRLGSGTLPGVGDFGDPSFLDQEIAVQWKNATNAGQYSDAYLALVRALIDSDSKTRTIRIGGIVSQCFTGSELVLAAKIPATSGSRFVFQYHDLVREILTRSHALGVHTELFHVLLHSACGAGRSYSNNQLDPQYRYIREEAERLAHCFAGDVILEPFYNAIVRYEIRDAEMNRNMFPANVDDL